ncbi:MAG: hypothetical protein WC140_04480 [Bacteroidales bacterium]
MNKAIFFKEWIKTKNAFWILFSILGLVSIYIIFQLYHTCEFVSAIRVWNNYLIDDKGAYINLMKLLPLLSGIILAFVQFVPEVTLKRIKLTLHVPYPQKRMLFMMISIGVLELLAIFGFSLGIYIIYLSTIVSHEIVFASFMVSLPWFIAGIAAYILVCAICLEPTWRGRVINALMAAAFINIFFISPFPKSYNYSIVGLIIVTSLCFLIVLRSMFRFKKGLQD